MPIGDIRAGEGRRWLMATMLAILLESSLIAGLAWYAQGPPVPLPKPHPPVQPIQVFMAGVVPASTPPTAVSAVLPKPIPAPALNPAPVQPELDTGREPGIKPVVGSDERAVPQSPPKPSISKSAPPTPMQPAHSEPQLESESKPQSTPKSIRKAGDRQEVPKAPRHEPQAAHLTRKPAHAPVRHARPSPGNTAASSASVTPPSSLKAEENPSAIPSRAAPSSPPTPVPPAPIPPDDLGDLIRTFGGRLSRAVQDNLRYPPAAQAMGQAGRTLVAFTIEAGQIRDVRVKRSSGSALLDAAAIRAVQTLACPPLPGPLADRTLPFTLWVRFDSD